MVTRTPAITVLQHNLGKGKTATAELGVVARRVNASVLLLQEPWVVRQSEVSGLGTLSNRILVGTRDERVWACIVILDPSLDVTILRHLSDAHCVCAHIVSPFGAFYLVSLYCQPTVDMVHSLNALRRIRTALGPVRLVVGADANAKSPLWFSRGGTDPRGGLLDDFLAETGWLVRNEPGNPPTFSTVNGTSTVDVTLATQGAWRLLRTWEVKRGWTHSDHRVITFTLGSRLVADPYRIARFNSRRTDWPVFLQTFEDLYVQEPPPPANRAEVEDLAKSITTNITICAETSTPRKTRFPRSVPWWTREHTNLKQQCNRKRRQLQRTRNPEARENVQLEYARLRRHYTRSVQRAKTTSWRSFVTELGNQDPYGIAYRVIRRKVLVDDIMASLRTEGTDTQTWEASAQCLLNTLMPDAPLDAVLNWRTQPRPPEDRSTRRWTHVEVTNIIKATPKNKAPGGDLIESVMLKQLAASPTCIRILRSHFNGCLEHCCFPLVWKHGVIRALLKNATKDPAEPSSYRPICLLPFLGKALEKLMKARLHSIIMHPQYASPRQYGFRRGKSTEDAILEVRRMVTASPSKYVMAILFDASAAFDLLSWHSVFRELTLRGCPSDMMDLLQNYLEVRTVELCGNYSRVTKTITRGCPQGSILGPDLWNMVLDGLLRILETNLCSFAAYADDLIVILSADSRLRMERAGQAACDTIQTWFAGTYSSLPQRPRWWPFVGLLVTDRPLSA